MSPETGGQSRIKRLFKGWIDRLETPDTTRNVMMLLLCMLGKHNRLRADYELTYACDDQPALEASPVDSSGSRASGKHPDAPQWRPFPKCPTRFRLFRAFNNVYMVYILLKYFFSKQIGLILGLFIELKRPIHCYLLGRYILLERLAEMSAALFSIALLAWYLSQVVTNPHRVDMIYFLMQPEGDRKWLYSRLGSKQRPLELAPDVNYLDQFSASERFLIDTMCYRVVYGSRVVFKLRANRNAEAHLKLRHRTATLTLVGIIIYVTVAAVFTIVFPAMHLLDQRYLRVYSNCDPDLERLNREGKITTWSMSFHPHRRLTFVADVTENCVVWFECGFLTIIAPMLVYLCNYDLVQLWMPISKKIEAMERIMREHSLHAASKRRASCQKHRYELGAEIADFIGQVEVAHGFSTQFLNAAVILCLGICVVYTYMLGKTSANEPIPWQLVLIFLFTGTAALLCLQSFLMVHYAFNSSYKTLCSLMARDKANQIMNYGAIVEFFVKHRDCALMLNNFRFVPTTFLTIIGWTFTCFCFSTQQAFA